jgi:hypothetical protein
MNFYTLIVISDLRAIYCAVAFRWKMTATYRRKKKKYANCCHKYCRRNLTLAPFPQCQCCRPVIMSPCSSAETYWYVCFLSTKTIVSVVVQTHYWPDTCRNDHHHHHHHHQYTLSISMCVIGKVHSLTCLCRHCGGGGGWGVQPIHNLGARKR